MYLLSDDEISFIVSYNIKLIKTRMSNKYNAVEGMALYLLDIRV